jgi:hypothetical protein
MNFPYSTRRRRLRSILDSLLDERSSREALDEAAAELYDLFSAISVGNDRGSGGTELPSGTALSPSAAATCTRDGMRTAVFVRGLRDAIAEAGRRFRGERIEVLYAGTGPFAVLAVPLMTVFSPTDVQFTLIDCHEESLQSVRTVLRHFGFGEFVRAILAVDAAVYRHRPNARVHVLVAEIMQRALGIEPQVEVFRNLASRLEPNGILVPESVTVDLVLGDPQLATTGWSQRGAGAGTVAGRVAELSDATLAARPDRRNRIDVRTLTLTHVPPSASAMYATTIRVFGRHVLREFDSGLTYPEIVWDLSNLQEGEQLAFWYELGRRPGIRWERVEAA